MLYNTAMENYNKFSNYLKNKFGEKVLKICVDGHFSCPNRDGTLSNTGCIYCSKLGSGELIGKFQSSNYDLSNHVIKSLNDNSIDNNIVMPSMLNYFDSVTDMCDHNSYTFNCAIDCDYIEAQVVNYLNSYRAKRANKFIVYFQNFSNTYDTIPNLKFKYDAALIDSRIVGIDIATRPDCIDDDICKLIASYKNKFFVNVELGLQTSNDKIGTKINRCYSTSDFVNSVKLLRKYGINVCAHIMLGLPFENRFNYFEYSKNLGLDSFNYDSNVSNICNNFDINAIDNVVNSDLIDTINLINSFDLQGLKIHSTYVVENTILADIYRKGEYVPLDIMEYLYYLVYTITHLKKDIVIHRIVGDAPKDMLVAPSWNLHKKLVINSFEKIMNDNNLYQGMFF